jgi:hypothetical protein
MSVDLNEVVDLICHTYHEARNVRHPIKAGKPIEASKYAKLTNLPNNPVVAWRDMASLRDRAAHSSAVQAATQVFQHFFDLSLADLVELYAMPVWKSSAYGGNPWADITSKVRNLVDVTNASGSRAEVIYREIISMDHNTGLVADKLRKLKGS